MTGTGHVTTVASERIAGARHKITTITLYLVAFMLQYPTILDSCVLISVLLTLYLSFGIAPEGSKLSAWEYMIMEIVIFCFSLPGLHVPIVQRCKIPTLCLLRSRKLASLIPSAGASRHINAWPPITVTKMPLLARYRFC